MMIDEIAVEPKYLCNWERVRFILDQCGIDFGRVISDFPRRKWSWLVIKACESCLPAEKSRITEQLNQAKTKLISRGRSYCDKDTWIRNTVREHGTDPFHLVISEEDQNRGPDWVEGAELSSVHPKWSISSDRVIPRTWREMCRCSIELLSMAREVVFIDPHFEIKAAYSHPLSGFIKNATKGKTVVRMEYHVKAKGTKDYFVDKLTTDLVKHLPSLPSCNLRIVRWASLPDKPGDVMHPRYILTDVGGLRYDYGLCEGNEGSTTDVALISTSSNIYEQRWKDYRASSPAFSFVDGFEVTSHGVTEIKIENGEFAATDIKLS